MSRLLVIVSVLAAVPAGLALRCYQCGDLEALNSISGGQDSGLGDLLGSSLAKKVMPPCKEFDPANPEKRFEADCPNSLAVPGLKAGCAKTKMGEMTIRMCQAAIPQEGCQEQGEMAVCYCEGDLCNGASLAAPALLLLAPAALLALLRA